MLFMSEEEKISEDVVRHFGPQWFGSVMGTALLSFVWVAVFLLTVRLVIGGEAFRPE